MPTRAGRVAAAADIRRRARYTGVAAGAASPDGARKGAGGVSSIPGSGPMSGTQISSDGLPPPRKKALFRAWHRGTKEMDLLLGTFADAHLGALSEDEFAEFERLMEVPDQDLFGWITGREPTPGNYDTGLFRKVEAFHLAPGGILAR